MEPRGATEHPNPQGIISALEHPNPCGPPKTEEKHGENPPQKQSPHNIGKALRKQQENKN